MFKVNVFHEGKELTPQESSLFASSLHDQFITLHQLVCYSSTVAYSEVNRYLKLSTLIYKLDPTFLFKEDITFVNGKAQLTFVKILTRV